jgi:hypothetical protein
VLTLYVPRTSVHAAEFNIDELQILTGLILIQELSKIENQIFRKKGKQIPRNKYFPSNPRIFADTINVQTQFCVFKTTEGQHDSM